MNIVKKITNTVIKASNLLYRVKNQNQNTDKTLRLESIFYSDKHGYPICRIQVVGHNIFKTYTTIEILKNRDFKLELALDDLEKIIRLDEQIKNHITNKRVIIKSYRESFLDKNNLFVNLQEVGNEEFNLINLNEIRNNNALLDRIIGSEAFKIGIELGKKENEISRLAFEKAKKERNKKPIKLHLIQ